MESTRVHTGFARNGDSCRLAATFHHVRHVVSKPCQSSYRNRQATDQGARYKCREGYVRRTNILPIIVPENGDGRDQQRRKIRNNSNARPGGKFHCTKSDIRGYVGTILSYVGYSRKSTSQQKEEIRHHDEYTSDGYMLLPGPEASSDGVSL